MFGFGKNTFLGIDIGTSTIKMVELKLTGNKPYLVNYARMHLDSLMGERDLKPSSFEVSLPEYLKRMLKEANIKSKNAYMSIPAFGGLITLIEFPDMVREDLDQAIKFEAHKYIPTSLDEIALSWDIVSKKGVSKLMAGPAQKDNTKIDPEGKIQVLLVAAPKNKVEKYERLASTIGLELKTIEIESFSMVRALVGNDQGNFIIVDMGSRICNIILVEKGVVKVNRNIDAGGREITRMIAQSMDIEEARAEKLKLSNKKFLDSESSITFPTLDFVVGEINRVISAFYKEEGNSKVDAVILSGGTANLQGLTEYFSNALQIKTVVGNPFSRIEYDQRLVGSLKELGPQFSVCIGLALKGVEEASKR